ncbi:MAG: HAMP domain-containing protein [Bacillus subtilis]|nr:HAMP domain-containing protein [Bacillus subtilis]
MPNGYEIGKYEPIKNSLQNVIGVMYIGISENRILEIGNNNISLISVFSIISLVVAIVIAALFSRTLTSPILKLVEATKSIASGNLDKRVEIKGNDEIAQLANVFNHMAKASLEKQEQLRDNFVATLTHDLKTPMLAENQTITYLLKEMYGPLTEDQEEVLNLIKSANKSSLEMVSLLLEVYRYDTGNATLVKSECDIVKLVRESIEQIDSLAKEKKITINLETKEENIFLWLDEREIKRVMHNLISNAIYNGIHRGKIECKIELIKNENYIYAPINESNEFSYP